MRCILTVLRKIAMILATLVPSAAIAEGPEGVRAWAEAAFAGLPAPSADARPGLAVRRQDHGRFHLNRSVIDTPMRIGEQAYERGLGTHAVSEITVRLPAPGRTLAADIGVDNNDDTGGRHGSIVFAVDVGGKEVYRSKVCRGGEAPVPVEVDLDGAQTLTLRVFQADERTGWDQADWARARVALADGKTVWLDTLPVDRPGTGPATAVPFSFTYGGKPSADLMPGWKRQAGEPERTDDGRERRTITWTDPATGLEITAEVTLFATHPAVEWVLRLTNKGEVDTPILEALRPLDLRVRVPADGKAMFYHAHGSTCKPTDFLPLDRAVGPREHIDMAPSGGRSSNGRLPFFNLQWPGGGVAGAIGWSGQWALRLERPAPDDLVLRAGQQDTHLLLHPGETIRTPRILLVWWSGQDRLRGHNGLRRVLLDHYLPRIDGELVAPPITANTWFTFNQGNEVTEANQLESIAAMAPLGVEVYWLDAGWFQGGWPTGVGSWDPKPESFPRGLKPLADAAHERSMKFIVWFEPERVHPASHIGREHPEFVLRTGDGDGLFNLGDPEARRWLTDYLSERIEKWDIDIYRNDFNIDPLPFWQKADAPDRRGMTEIRYVEGLYAMWDELRQRRPGLWIDNCSSGGRRIDLETLSRSLPLWRSDTQCCGHAEPVQDQCQMAGLSLYVPLHTSGCWSFDPYVFRSIATTGTNLCMDLRAANVPAEQAKAAIAEAKALRPLYGGDFYPLTAITPEARDWCGWQLHRPDLGHGLAVFFRRPDSPYSAIDASLHGLDPDAAYEVTVHHGYAPEEAQRMAGKDLAHLRAEIPEAPGSVLITYQRVK